MYAAPLSSDDEETPCTENPASDDDTLHLRTRVVSARGTTPVARKRRSDSAPGPASKRPRLDGVLSTAAEKRIRLCVLAVDGG